MELPMKFDQSNDKLEMKFITGGVLMQEKDLQTITADDLTSVTDIKPVQSEVNDMLFAWRVLKHIKSNGVLIVRHHTTVGIGAGQVSRIDAVEIAIRKAGSNLKNTILASDAFFPFRDSIDRIAEAGIRLIIQPGGSIRDEEVITACNEHQIAMVFTGKRCFKH
jgi:phosphoribosylaminoimidazolecarboxamide formyltransferase/IMP cyclohydrolase